MTHRSSSASDVLTSMTNPVIKRIRSLQRRKYRVEERAFVVEGVRAVNDVLSAGLEPLSIVLRSDVSFPVPDHLQDAVRKVNGAVFDSLTDTAHPQGVLAVVPMLDEQPWPDVANSPLVVVLDGVRDPGNMGTLLRSAAGAGVDHVIIGPESVDPYNPKTVRSAMGAHLKVPFSHGERDKILTYLADFPLVALADAGGKALYDSVNWQSASVMIIGGEAFGPSSASHDAANVVVSIPLVNEVESLNAGVAGSLLMFEAARQRRSGNAS